MHKYFSKKDIYNEKGILLLKKGQKVDSTIITKLRNAGISMDKLKNMFNFNDKKNVGITKISDEFRARMNIPDHVILDKPNKILSSILFDSKDEPWWIYVNSLANYVKWIYAHSIDVAKNVLILFYNTMKNLTEADIQKS
ncbi:hypothetical protein [Clostridium sp. cel8]|jgi:hypothetical protein|uniref:hypothetical protein n=1 Tax=unclassified Clostridium TaxID=2614128 RepID=UPI001FAD2C03|nr:hypothetical protein [Clostridium sp. cel8]